MPRNSRNRGASRRRFIQGSAATAGVLALAPSFVMKPRRASAATLDNVHTEAAKAAKELAAGRSVTLTIMEPSGSLGNVKPVADQFTAETGINIEYVEVPLGEINQKVLLEAVSKTGSFDIALPATFGIPDLAESGILVNLGPVRLEVRARGLPAGRALCHRRLLQGQPLRLPDRRRHLRHVLSQGLAGEFGGEQGLLRQARLCLEGAGHLGRA